MRPCPPECSCSAITPSVVPGDGYVKSLLEQLETLRSEDLAAALDLPASQTAAAELVVEAILAATQDLRAD